MQSQVIRVMLVGWLSVGVAQFSTTAGAQQESAGGCGCLLLLLLLSAALLLRYSNAAV